LKEEREIREQHLKRTEGDWRRGNNEEKAERLGSESDSFKE